MNTVNKHSTYGSQYIGYETKKSVIMLNQFKRHIVHECKSGK